MSETAEARLAALGITLPEPAAPAANYVPFVLAGKQLFVSGQLPLSAGKVLFSGRLGADLELEDGVAAARLCAINILAQAKAALGDLEKIVRCVKLGGFVACTSDFTDQPKVINGASDLMVEVLGERGRHARFAVGAPALPLGVAVEIDALFEVE
ncbi:MAG: RidA family protein [Rhodobiaceae bacterium]|nr:RidA family protein [Rhodobiaceae bacterium]